MSFLSFAPAARIRVPGVHRMLHWALVFFVVALIAALFGLRGVAGMSAQVGKMLVVLAVVVLVVYVVLGRAPVPP
jgi:uncharacterized membrane protein YtjA (UPF0391 family)